MTIGERIKKLRLEKGLTQQQLSEKCGIDSANLRKYELGKQNPKFETIERIAKALEVSPFDLKLGEYSQAGLDAINGASDYLQESMIELTGIGKELIRETKLNTLLSTFVKLNDEGQTKVINYAVDIAPKYQKDE